jgi:hypothetical protein
MRWIILAAVLVGCAAQQRRQEHAEWDAWYWQACGAPKTQGEYDWCHDTKLRHDWQQDIAASERRTDNQRDIDQMNQRNRELQAALAK